jgi:hypothetical protein
MNERVQIYLDPEEFDKLVVALKPTGRYCDEKIPGPNLVWLGTDVVFVRRSA